MSDYLSINETQKQQMLKKIGVEKVDDFYQDIPPRMRAKPLQIPEAKSIKETVEYMKSVSDFNYQYKTILVGAGCYNHFIPQVVKKMTARNIPHTAKISSTHEGNDGLIQTLYEYEKIISSLTGIDVTTSPQDSGAVAAAKACLMCAEKGQKVLTFDNINPDLLDVLKTYLSLRGVKLIIYNTKDGRASVSALKKIKDIACVVLQTPNFYGLIENGKSIAQLVHAYGAKLIVYTNPISLGLLQAPGDYDADIAVGDLQPLGMGMNYGGAALGFLSAKRKLASKLPGIVVDKKKDKFTFKKDGEKADEVELSTKEILSALTAVAYLNAVGTKGLKEIGTVNTSNAHYLAIALEYVGCGIKYPTEFFNEFVTVIPGRAKRVQQALHNVGVLGGWVLNDDEILWCCTEVVTKDEIDNVVNTVGGVL